MKKLLVVLLLVLGVSGLNAQEIDPPVKEGSIFEIAAPQGQQYKHINFPNKNFIIKRGGIANDKLVYGEKVVVTEVFSAKDGSTKVRIKPLDGTKFYRALRSVTVDFDDAIKTGELTR